MIKGKVADSMYWGGIIVLIVSLIGVFILAAMSVERPPEIIMVITTVVGFVFGTHVAPTKKLNDHVPAKPTEPLVMDVDEGGVLDE